MVDVAFQDSEDVQFQDSADVSFQRRASFLDVLNGLGYLLEYDPALTSFCQEKWYGRTLTVKRMFKQRTEIKLRDLPIILITRPDLNKSHLIEARDGVHTVRLYCGFHQRNYEIALDQLIEFEELIDDTLMQIEPGDIDAINIIPKETSNDEGYFHPTYFTVMDVEIWHRR